MAIHKAMRSLFPEAYWWQGGCLSLARAVCDYLREHGFDAEVLTSDEHAIAKCGKHEFDADMYGLYRTRCTYHRTDHLQYSEARHKRALKFLKGNDPLKGLVESEGKIGTEEPDEHQFMEELQDLLNEAGYKTNTYDEAGL